MGSSVGVQDLAEHEDVVAPSDGVVAGEHGAEDAVRAAAFGLTRAAGSRVIMMGLCRMEGGVCGADREEWSVWIIIRTPVDEVGGEFKPELFFFTHSFDTNPTTLGLRRQLAAARAATCKPGHLT